MPSDVQVVRPVGAEKNSTLATPEVASATEPVTTIGVASADRTAPLIGDVTDPVGAVVS